jgi:CheY-specific phosphatase CheX
VEKSTVEVERALGLISAATADVFRRMLASEVQVGASTRNPAPLLRSEVSGVVVFRGDFHGCLSLHCSRLQADEFTRRLLYPGTTTQPSAHDVRSTISELVSIISGGLRSQLAAEFWIESSLPMVFSSPQIELRVEASEGWVVPIEDPSGPFQLELIAFPELAGSV